MARDQDLTEAICIFQDIWPQFPPEVHWRGDQVEIVIDAELMAQVRPGQRAPILEGRARTYRASTWEDAIRNAGHAEGVSPALIEDRIRTAKQARRDGRTVIFSPIQE